MKILQICSARDIGGGERHLADLANGLAQRGHEVFAAVNPNAPIAAELRELPGENIFELRMRGSADALAAEQIARIVRENHIDLIHAHIARDYPVAALAAARSGGTPFVLTRHVLFPMRRLHKVLLGKAARVIAVSNAVAGVLRKQQIFKLDKIVTIHNGIDAARFSTIAANRLVKHRSRVGTIGHIAAIKGQDIFVRAAAEAIKARHDVEFVIVGQDKSPGHENETTLKRLIDDLALTEHVQLSGWQDDVTDVLGGFDIFVSAARSEPFGLVILEAMAAGSPVIATASEGACEIIEDGVTGVLVPIGDPKRLAAAIVELLENADKRKTLANNALKAVRQRFSLERMVETTELAYHDALRRSV